MQRSLLFALLVAPLTVCAAAEVPVAVTPPSPANPGAAPEARETAPANAVPVSEAEDSRWTRTLEKVATGVVTIQVDLTRAFDTEWNMSSQATGFVVDAKRGL